MSSNDWNGLVPSVIMRYIIITLITLIFISINANALTPTVNSTHFLIYDLANAGSSYDQALDNYLEQAYSLYTNTLGMKMSPPCSGSQYTVYVVSSLPGSEAGVTGWEYTYNPNTGQIISTCIEYINISAGLSSDWLEHTAYHELVHVSQLAYMQYTTIPQDYPWYIEADAEGTASYYTNQCPMAQDYFQYNQYGYDPYDYSGEPIINMYYYSAFIYWLIANGIGPATIEQNVFAGNSIINSWLDNYYTQYLVSLVHGQNLCGSTYYPSFQTISMSGSTYSFSVSLQGLSAQYYKVQLPATGTIEITAGGGSVISNIELNSAFSITNTTLYMALVNPTTNNETVTLTISYTPGITARIVGGTYNVMTESLTLNLYVMYGTAPITGTIYINGTPTSASNGYASATFTGITWGTYVVNVTYENSTALTYITLGQPTASLVTTTTLYLTSNSFGNLVISVNNPNSVTLVTDMLITSPPSPINPYKPMIYFEPPNTTLILGPGTSTIKINFVVNSTVSNGQGDIYIYNSPSTALSLGYDVVPVQVSIINATYYINGNYTIVDTYVNDVGKMNFVIGGFTGTVYINYSTYTITTLKIGVVSPTVRLLPEIVLLAPSWALVNTTIELMTPNSCPSFPVFYYGEFYVNNTYVGSKLVSCGSIGVVWNLLNETYTGQYMVLSVAGMNIMANISIVPPLINVVNYLWNITSTNEYVIVNLSIYGPYEYAVLSHYVNNSTLQLTYSLPANYTMLTINTGFGNITVSRPTPLISLESPAVTIYPQPINAVINITMPPTLAYQGLLNTYLNGSLYSSTTVDLSPGESSLLGMVIKPTVPGTYVINVELGASASINVTVMSVELFRLSIEAEPLVIIGHNETINIILNDYPAISVHVNLTLQGCINDTTMVMANTSLSLGFNRECALLINASAYALTGEAISYWDYLNLWINNTVGYYDGYPLILNGTITAYATFLNGSEVPATVLINGSTTLTPRYLGLITITLSINYLGATNESTVSAYVIPPTYFEAEKILSELGNPQFLNATVSNAIMSGNWSLVDEIINEYQASSRPYDPLAQLSRYLLVQAIMSGSVSKISLVNAILRYELLIYTVLILIIILVMVALHRVRARSRKS